MHPQDLPQKCRNCGEKLVNNTTIMNHSTDMHGQENPKECGNCANICSNTTISERHVSTHRSVNKYECTDCAQIVTRMKNMLTPKSYKHEAIPQTNVMFVGKSVANVRKHTDEMHNKFRKSCTICEEALTISSMDNHKRRVHGTQIHPCEACQCHYGWAHTNLHVGTTKTNNLKKRSKKKTVEVEKTKKPAGNANKSAADDESKDDTTESDSAYQSSTEELKEASDDKVKDDDAANLGVEPKTATKSQTESKPKNKPIPESKPQSKAGETGYSPATFGNYTCA